MGKIIDLVKFIWNGFWDAAKWLVGVPGLLITSVGGIVSAVTTLIDNLSTGGSMADAVSGVGDEAVQSIVSTVGEFPDIVRLAMYCLSLDVLFDYVISVFGLFVSLTFLVATFFLVSVPAFLISFYVTKFTAALLVAIFPQGWCPTALSMIANMGGVPVRESMNARHWYEGRWI